MPDEEDRSEEDDALAKLLELAATLEDEDPAEKLDEPLPSPRSVRSDRQMTPLVRGALILAWYGLAAGALVFSLLVYPGWRSYLELLEFILRWASSAP